MSVLHLVVFALATWRISSLFVSEDGPFFIFENLRTRSGIEYHLVSNRTSVTDQIKIVPDKFFSQLLSCIWCISPYVGASWLIFFLISPLAAFFFAIPFALSACAILFNLIIEKLKI